MEAWYVWAAWPFLVIGAVYLLVRRPFNNDKFDWFSPGATEEAVEAEVETPLSLPVSSELPVRRTPSPLEIA